jgi:hypothetical protein
MTEIYEFSLRTASCWMNWRKSGENCFDVKSCARLKMCMSVCRVEENKIFFEKITIREREKLCHEEQNQLCLQTFKSIRCSKWRMKILWFGNSRKKILWENFWRKRMKIQKKNYFVCKCIQFNCYVDIFKFPLKTWKLF